MSLHFIKNYNVMMCRSRYDQTVLYDFRLVTLVWSLYSMYESEYTCKEYNEIAKLSIDNSLKEKEG